MSRGDVTAGISWFVAAVKAPVILDQPWPQCLCGGGFQLHVASGLTAANGNDRAVRARWRRPAGAVWLGPHTWFHPGKICRDPTFSHGSRLCLILHLYFSTNLIAFSPPTFGRLIFAPAAGKFSSNQRLWSESSCNLDSKQLGMFRGSKGHGVRKAPASSWYLFFMSWESWCSWCYTSKRCWIMFLLFFWRPKVKPKPGSMDTFKTLNSNLLVVVWTVGTFPPGFKTPQFVP